MAMFNSYVTNYQRVPTITLWSAIHLPPPTPRTHGVKINLLDWYDTCNLLGIWRFPKKGTP